MAVLKRRFTVHPVEIDGEPFEEVTCGESQLRFSLRPVDPVVFVRGVEVRFEAVIEVKSRRFHGYGTDRLSAFVNAREAAMSEGALEAPWDTFTPNTSETDTLGS